MTTIITASLAVLVMVLIVIDIIQKHKTVSRNLGLRSPTDRSQIPHQFITAFDLVLEEDSGLSRDKIRLDDNLTTLGYGIGWIDDWSLDLCRAIHDHLKIDRPIRSFNTLREAVDHTNALLKELPTTVFATPKV